MTKLPETCARSVLPVILWIAAFLCLSTVLTYPSLWQKGWERLDGNLGLHVDVFIGGGEGMSRVAVEGWNHVPVGEQNFVSRVKWLKTKLELGSLHLGLSFPFTGIQLTQSPNFECIQLSLENYLQKVKPIALSKERRQNPSR